MTKMTKYSLLIAGVIMILVYSCKKDKTPPTAPTLTTTAISSVGFNSATSGGTITSNGGATITVSGICWSKTNTLPTITDSLTHGITASGSFTGTLNNLTDGVTYYVRAYATNSAGTGYGNVVTFNTIVDTTHLTFMYNGVSVTYGVITSPTTGRKWLDRNLGASRAGTTFDDDQAFGDLFQWGRLADGHQSRTSGTTSTLSTSDVPGNSNFILTSDAATWYDWRNPQNDNLWQGSHGINNPCPSGWHVPMSSEWSAETSITDYNAAYTQLKLTTGGQRYSDGALQGVGGYCIYWSGTVIGNNSFYFFVDASSTNNANSAYARGLGLSIRCIKD